MIDDPSFKVLMANAEAEKRGLLSVWTIYEKPLDHPDGFIARRHEGGKGGHHPTMDTVEGDLMHIRATFERAGLYRLPRDEGDEPQIVESWI
jgi:hypothetical protein